MTDDWRILTHEKVVDGIAAISQRKQSLNEHPIPSWLPYFPQARVLREHERLIQTSLRNSWRRRYVDRWQERYTPSTQGDY